ncbi:MAG: ceramidase domain-containing protein [Pseudomonadota bacterium]
MDWHRQIDIYCERLDFSFWAEPINALTNGAFPIVAGFALYFWLKENPRDWPRLFFILLIPAIALGSFLFHTTATVWAVVADLFPIAVFIYGFFFLSMRRFFGLDIGIALVCTGLFLGVSIAARAYVPGEFLNGSGSYLPALGGMLMLSALLYLSADRVERFLQSGKTRAYATLSAAHAEDHRLDATARRRAGRAMGLAALFFIASLTARSLDMAVCEAIPFGIHFMWHLLNAFVLFFVIESGRHMWAGRAS